MIALTIIHRYLLLKILSNVLDLTGENLALRGILLGINNLLNEGRDFDYAGKYLGDGVLEITPAEISPEESQHAQALACMAHTALGCWFNLQFSALKSTFGGVI